MSPGLRRGGIGEPPESTPEGQATPGQAGGRPRSVARGQRIDLGRILAGSARPDPSRVRQEVNAMHTPNLLVAYSSPGTFLPRNPDVAGPIEVVLVAGRSTFRLVVRSCGHVL